jgi:membrane protein implicated in regulation of membrane protease activity
MGLYFLWHLSKLNAVFHFIFFIYCVGVIIYYYSLYVRQYNLKQLKVNPLFKKVKTPNGKVGVITSYMNGTACVKLETGVYRNYDIDELTIN